MKNLYPGVLIRFDSNAQSLIPMSPALLLAAWRRHEFTTTLMGSPRCLREILSATLFAVRGDVRSSKTAAACIPTRRKGRDAVVPLSCQLVSKPLIQQPHQC